MIECYTSEYPKARREHSCEFCKGRIQKGEKYSYEKWKSDGEFFTSKLCIPCDNMVKEYCGETGNTEYSLDDVEDFLAEEHCRGCNNSDDCLKIPQRCGDVIKIYKGEQE